MANSIIMNMSKKVIEDNAKTYGIGNIIDLCNKVTGIMAYNETNEEYNFLVNTVFPHYTIEELPCRYLVIAATIIRDIMFTEDANLARAKVYFNMSSMSFRNGDMETYYKYRKILEKMVRDHVISPEFVRDLPQVVFTTNC